jgi:hypothetical protein
MKFQHYVFVASILDEPRTLSNLSKKRWVEVERSGKCIIQFIDAK